MKPQLSTSLKSISWTVLATTVALAVSGCLSQEQQDAAKRKVVSGVITAINKLNQEVNAQNASASQSNLPVGVVVNGVQYQTNNAVISVDGQQSSRNELKTGMYVTLEATIDSDGKSGVADHIEYDSDVRGVVSANDYATNRTITVLGQIIHIDNATILADDSDQRLLGGNVTVGQLVEISGYKTNGGDIYATRIEIKNASSYDLNDNEVEGTVAWVNTSNQTFAVGNLTIDYSKATFEHGAVNDLTVGAYVDVDSVAGLDSNQQLVASKIELGHSVLAARSSFGHDDSSNRSNDYEIEGIVTAPLTNGVIEINGEKINVPSNVKIEHGNLNALANSTRVEVKLVRDANNNWVAIEIEVRTGSETHTSDNDDKNSGSSSDDLDQERD